MMEFALHIDDKFVYDQRSDGLIVATPTGSTAYALSAGGPIMHPSLDAIVVVPMFPHTLTSRPLVVPSASRIKIVIGRDDVDESADQLRLAGRHRRSARRRSPHPKCAHALKLLYSRQHSFYEACRSKLDWASRLGGPVKPE